MTPERRQELCHILDHQDGLDTDMVLELFNHVDAQAAEIATLRAQRDALVEAAEWVTTIHKRYYSDDPADEPVRLVDVDKGIDALASAVAKVKDILK